MQKLLEYDDHNMWEETCGKGGISHEAYRMSMRRLIPAIRAIESLQNIQGWLSVPNDTLMRTFVLKQAREVIGRFGRMIVIGIGGSDLAARTLYQALGNPKKGIALEFVSAPDPEFLSLYTTQPRTFWKNTAVCIISKSGTTLETLTVAAHVVHELKKALGKRHKEHVYVITEKNQGPLHRIAQTEGYRLLPHPKNIGGRFSALSVVGLFPAACAGIDIHSLHAGARAIMTGWKKERSKHCSARFAAHHANAYESGLRLHVLMPYAEWLSNFGLWYRQLWAESLGKLRGQTPVGPTPVTGTGPVDQHSQIQLYNEGPKDKIVTFLQVKKFRTSLSVPNPWPAIPETDKLAKLDYGAIMQAELEGTERALTAHGRPNGRLIIPVISEQTMGALMQFYMLSTAMIAELLGVNAYNQPGVEEGKQQTKTILGV